MLKIDNYVRKKKKKQKKKVKEEKVQEAGNDCNMGSENPQEEVKSKGVNQISDGDKNDGKLSKQR